MSDCCCRPFRKSATPPPAPQCLNNLKQLGLAYHNYAQSNNSSFARSMITDQTKTVGWGIFLLPYIEQTVLYSQYNLSAPFFYTNAAAGINNQAISKTPIKLYICPAARGRTGPYAYTFYYPPYPSYSWQAYASDYTPGEMQSSGY